MPSVIAHYLLNRRLLDSLPGRLSAPGAKEAFLWRTGAGRAFHAGQPSLKGKNLINKASSRRTATWPSWALKPCCKPCAASPDSRPALEAYLKGFAICLDRAAAPYIHWAADRLGDASKTRTGGLRLHFRVETALDIILLRSETARPS